MLGSFIKLLTTHLPVLSSLAACTADVKLWFVQNVLQLNPDKSEALIMGTADQLRAASSLTSVRVAGVDLRVAEDVKVLGFVLDWLLTFDKHVSAVARSCNYHAQAIRHIRHLLTTDLAQMLACSLILSMIDYCNAVLHTLHPAPSTSCSGYRTTLQGLFIKHQDDHMHTRC